jgi:hypothetical protein
MREAGVGGEDTSFLPFAPQIDIFSSLVECTAALKKEIATRGHGERSE